jgi:ParB family chromosome partitioning protein
MKLRQIPVDQIIVPKVRVTAVYDEEHLALLRSSLEAMGTVNPIIVVAVDGGYEVVDGLHRWQEAKSRGEKTISAVVHEGGPQESLLMNLVLNRVRGKVKASEMVSVIEELWITHKMDSEAIAAKTGLGRDYIEKLQVISQASLPLKQALEEERIGTGAAFEIARLPNPLQQEQVLNQHLVYNIPIKELHQLVSNVLKEMEAQKTATPKLPLKESQKPPVYNCEACRKEIDPKYLRPIVVCPDCFGQVWRLAKASAEVPLKVEQPQGGG